MLGTRRKHLVNSLLFIVATLFVAWLGIRWASSQASAVGLHEPGSSSLADCPDRPNCVCSSASQPAQKIEPFTIRSQTSNPIADLESLIRRLPGNQIIVAQDGYLHAEFRSKVFGFIDDLELLVDNDHEVVEVRSASRVGYSDLGVNRKRVEEIRRLYNAL